MTDTVLLALEGAAAAVSLLLMGICAFGLLIRLAHILQGKESADGLAPSARFAPARALLFAAGLALFSRLALYLLAYGMHRMGGGQGGLFATLEMLWSHWDTRHYIGIAQHGYTAVGDERLQLVFFPLYPMIMRLCAPLTGGNLFAAGLMVSLGCASLASALVYDLAYLHGGRETANRALAYFLLSPLSVFLCCAYTESLFICLTLLAVCLLRRGKPWLAALCGMGSALTRMPGVIIAGLMIIALLEKIPQRKLTARAVLGCMGQVLLVFSGLFLYWGINWVVTGDPLMYMVYQRENWFQEPGSFWGSTANTMHYFLTTMGDGDWLYTWGFQLLCMLVMYMLLAFGMEALPFDLAAYSFVYTAVVLAPTWLLSAPRYLYALCALPLMLSKQRIGRRGHALWLCLSFALLVCWVYGYTIAGEVL